MTTNNNNNNNNTEFESIKNSIDNLKRKKQNNDNQFIDFKTLNSKPTVLTGIIFGAAAFYYSVKGKKQLSTASIATAAILLVSGQMIDSGNTKAGAALAGATTALMAGSSFAGAFKHKKVAPLFLGSISFISMGYHAFFTLYNNKIDQTIEIIQSHNENIKKINEDSK